MSTERKIGDFEVMAADEYERAALRNMTAGEAGTVYAVLAVANAIVGLVKVIREKGASTGD